MGHSPPCGEPRIVCKLSIRCFLCLTPSFILASLCSTPPSSQRRERWLTSPRRAAALRSSNPEEEASFRAHRSHSSPSSWLSAWLLTKWASPKFIACTTLLRPEESVYELRNISIASLDRPCIHIFMYIYISMYVYVCVYANICIYVYAYVCTYICE